MAGTASGSYDHIVKAWGLFEVHMGPRREFGIFKGVQDSHRELTRQPSKSLKAVEPHRDGEQPGRSSAWDIPSLNLVFSVTLGGGSRTDCESWYVLLEPSAQHKPS